MADASVIKSRERYVFIDALRGLACLGVLLYHVFFNTVMVEPLHVMFPAFVIGLVYYGHYGVQIFFVLSGFVIAHSLRNTPLTRRGIGQFMLRRQVRLDPPYWAALLLALGMHAVALVVVPGSVSSFPSLSQIGLNFVYLQDLFKAEPVLIVAWTLCLEVQFYIVFILLLALAAKFSGISSPVTPTNAAVRRMAVILLVISGCASLLSVYFANRPTWFTAHWFYFVAGVLCYWSVRAEIDRRILLGFLLIYSGLMLTYWRIEPAQAHLPNMLVGLVTCCAIYLVGYRKRLTTLWNWSVIQYFGRISYSLYLVHWLVVVTVFRIGSKLTGDKPAFALLYAVAAIGLSIGAAHLFFMMVEKPSMNLAAHLKGHEPAVRSLQPIATTNSGFATETDSTT